MKEQSAYSNKILNEILEDVEADFRNFSEGSIAETTAEEKLRQAAQNGQKIEENFIRIGSPAFLRFLSVRRP